MSALRKPEPVSEHAALRAWLEYVAALAIDWLDELDAADEDREDDEGGEVVF